MDKYLIVYIIILISGFLISMLGCAIGMLTIGNIIWQKVAKGIYTTGTVIMILDIIYIMIMTFKILLKVA